MTVINLITPAEFINGITVWAAPMFAEFQSVIFVTLGFIGAALILIWLIDTVSGAMGAIFGKKDDSIF